MAERINSYKELHVYQNAMEAAMAIFQISKSFPREEKYSLVDQIRRSSRSVCLNIAEAWRKRRYEAAFISKLNDSEAEASETQVWLEFAWRCGSLKEKEMKRLDETYDHILGQLVLMIDSPKEVAHPLAEVIHNPASANFFLCFPHPLILAATLHSAPLRSSL